MAGMASKAVCSMPLRILVADDDADLRESVVELLTVRGASVVSVPSGAELLARLGEGEPYDLVITDMLMPWLTGLQVASSVREAGLDVPVILITGASDDSLEGRVDSLERAGLLREPFGADQLHAAIVALLPGTG